MELHELCGPEMPTINTIAKDLIKRKGNRRNLSFDTVREVLRLLGEHIREQKTEVKYRLVIKAIELGNKNGSFGIAKK